MALCIVIGLVKYFICLIFLNHSVSTDNAYVGGRIQRLSSDAALGYISSLVDKEALMLSANHVFLIWAGVVIFAAMMIWLEDLYIHNKTFNRSE